MSDEHETESQSIAVVDQDSDNRRKPYRDYSLDDKFIALAAVDLNGGNIYRTARALEIPYATLHGWVEERMAGSLVLSKFEREKRGDLAAKMESVIHSCVESMPTKIPKATLSQTAVATGILVDKVRILRGEGLDPDPATELCRLLNINRAQLPPTLELGPGEEVPEEFVRLLEAKPNSTGQFEVENPAQSADAKATVDDECDSNGLVPLKSREGAR